MLSMNWSPAMALGCLGGGVCTTLFFVCWPLGLMQVEASVAALFGGILPVATAVLAAFFLGESMTFQDFAGMFFILLSIILGAYNQLAAPKLADSKNYK